MPRRVPLEEAALSLILEVTACHPYYVNALCRRLWAMDKLPDATVVMHAWRQLTQEKRYEVSSDFEKLTPIQRNILIELARQPFAKLTSKEIIARLNASLSGITNALKGLVEHDYVERDEQGYYRVLNPLMEFVLRQPYANVDA